MPLELEQYETSICNITNNILYFIINYVTNENNKGQKVSSKNYCKNALHSSA